MIFFHFIFISLFPNRNTYFLTVKHLTNMEEHRLKPMKRGYDEKLFNELYSKTEGLRKKLASQIDCRRFGVDYNEILSWFDVKFIFAFNKYYGEKEPEALKAHIINALQFFKQRILRSSYSQKSQINNRSDTLLSLDDVYGLKEPQVDHTYDERNTLVNIGLSIMKNKLSYEAYRVLEVEINPPMYILDQLAAQDKFNTTKIPSFMIADYLGLGSDKPAIKYINTLKQEIDMVYETI